MTIVFGIEESDPESDSVLIDTFSSSADLDSSSIWLNDAFGDVTLWSSY